MLVGFVGGAIIFIFANAIVRVFIDDVQIVSYGTSMLRALMISSPVVGIIFVLSNLFQAMGKGTQSMVLAVGRQGIIFIPVIYIMSHLLNLKGIINVDAGVLISIFFLVIQCNTNNNT